MKQKMLKSMNGITLVSLIVTIIILLILAMVSISLIMNNGIITKSKTAVDKYSEEEIGEQMKLAYSEYQMSKFTSDSQDLDQIIKIKLENIYGAGNVDIISLEENIVIKVNSNGDQKFYEYNPSTSKSKKLQKGINYNGKIPSEIQPGDDITIVTEKFKVFAVADGKIKAMPYYNITLTDKPVQSKNAGKITFSSANYWIQGDDQIDMSDSRNNIQKYITAYKTTLEILGINEITVRAAKYSELSAEGITNGLKNPGQSAYYWTCSSRSDEVNGVWAVAVRWCIQ